MFQGTASHVGKSVLTAAFCRILRRRGLRVAPFKAMNMSNNAWVTRQGGEMAIAQAAQARACGVEPTVEMNPVLLKATSDRASQVVVLGRAAATVAAADLKTLRGRLTEAIEESLHRLLREYEVVVMEGAGSPTEVNLRETDFANMAAAELADAHVVIVADIERGGVFAQIVGTWELLRPEERRRVLGFIINKFRGDPALLSDGTAWLEQRVGRRIFGVLPYLADLRIPEEDSLAERLAARPSSSHTSLRVQILQTPTMANFTDFDPLHREPGVEVEYLTQPPDGALPHLLILPGSKATVADLGWLRQRGLDRYVQDCAGQGVEVLGICGGFQMLGETIYDPSHVESQEAAARGLGLLPTSTLFLPTKVTDQVGGVHLDSGARVRGYEIHCGRMQGGRKGRPIFRLQERGGAAVDELDGCQAEGRPVWGTYLHGLFDEDEFRHALLNRLRDRYQLPQPSEISRPFGARDDNSPDPFDQLADAVRAHIAVDEILERAGWTP